MVKHSNIVFFIFISMSLHGLLLLQQNSLQPVHIAKLGHNINIELSRALPAQRMASKADIRKDIKPQPYKKTSSPAPHQPVNEVKAASQSPLEHKQEIKTQPQQQPEIKPEQVRPASILQNPETTRRKTSEYLQQIISLIEKNKFYPAAARRRGMQETIQVSFTLQSNGSINDIEISGRYKPLRIAAEAAIKSALPFQSPPSDIRTPYQIRYAMAFKLN